MAGALYAHTLQRHLSLLRMVNLTEDDVFVDLGGGLGRAVFAASWMGARRAVGIEVVPDLCKKAVENLKRSHSSGGISNLFVNDALNYRHAAQACFLCFILSAKQRCAGCFTI